MIKVRVFVPADGSSETYECDDFHFETMPREGQFLRLFTPEPGDYPIERVGFIQEDAYFVAAVWVARPPVKAWASRQEQDEGEAEHYGEINDNGARNSATA